MITEYIIETLARSTIPTWRHERCVFLLVEALCLLAGILAAPTREASLLLAVVAPFALWQTELGRADRSAKARESERAEALRLPKVELACKAAIDQAAKNRQLATAGAPLVALAAAVAGAGGKGAVVAAIVGFGVSVVRWGMVELYGPWRAWYRERVPVRVEVKAAWPTTLVRVNRAVRKGEIVTDADVERGACGVRGCPNMRPHSHAEDLRRRLNEERDGGR